MQAWNQIQERYVALTIREKVLILCSGLVLFLFGGYTLLVEPSAISLKRSQQQVEKLSSDQAKLQAQLQSLNQKLVADPNQALQQEIERLTLENQRLDQSLADQTVDLIPPHKMADVLEQLLQRGRKLKLLSLSSLTPEPTLDMDESDPETSQVNLYRHGIVLKLEGRYFDILKFLGEVEDLPWRFYWQRFDYSVEQHPKAIAEIELYSLSTSKEFIGG